MTDPRARLKEIRERCPTSPIRHHSDVMTLLDVAEAATALHDALTLEPRLPREQLFRLRAALAALAGER